jgi:hypothetical protein
VCVHSCCSVCSTNEVDGNVSTCKCQMMMSQKYKFELRDCSHILSCHKEAGISLAKMYKSFKFIVAMGS